MLRPAALMLIFAAGPAVAQDGAPPFDGGLIDDCLAVQQGDGGQPEYCIGAAAGPCTDTPEGYTTMGMSYCLSREWEHWDALLNIAYGDLMAQAKEADADLADGASFAPEQAPHLRDMQRKWIAYRDAACSYEGSRWGGGSGAGPAGTQCMLTLTARQYILLNDYLEQVQ